MTTSTIFNIKRNDTSKNIECTLKINNVAVDNLGLATGVKFIMRLAAKKNAAPKVAAAAIIDDPVLYPGAVHYEWGTGDTDTAGTYSAEWEVTYSGGGVATFPDDGYLTVNVVADLG